MAASTSNAKISKTLAPSFSLADLPDGPMEKIAALVAADSIQDFHSLVQCSPCFARLSNETSILFQASLDISMLRWNRNWNPNPRNPRLQDHYLKYERFVYRCEEAKNPRALMTLFNIGLKLFFECCPMNHRTFHERALKNIGYASQKGIQEATEWYGLLLIALGQNRRQGYEILRPFTISLTATAVWQMKERWLKRLTSLRMRVREYPVVFFINATYHRDDCEGDRDCLTTKLYFAIPDLDWLRYVESPGETTNPACEVCLWHQVLILIFALP